jgi:hypothetical protein
VIFRLRSGAPQIARIDLCQQRDKLFGGIQHRFVAARHRAGLPASAFCTLVGHGEGSSLPSGAQNMGDIRNLLDTTAKIETFLESADGLDRALRFHPTAIVLVNLEDLGWKWIDFPTLTCRLGLAPAALSLLGPQMIEEAFAILHNECIEVNQCAEALGDSVGDATDYPTSIRMTAENHICKFFPEDQVDDVGDMSG